MRRLIIHIGMHRAQSTSIQYALNYIQNECTDFSFIYPRIGQSIAENELGSHDLFVNNETGEISHKMFQELELSLKFIPSHIPCIISSEEFWRSDPYTLKTVASKFFKPTIFCVEREFYSWIISVWSLLIVQTKVHCTFKEFLVYVSQEVSINSESFFSVTNKISNWKKEFGSEIHIANFPLNSPHYEILDLCISNYPKEWSDLSIHVNESPSINEIIAINRLSFCVNARDHSDVIREVEQTINLTVPNAVREKLIKYLDIDHK